MDDDDNKFERFLIEYRFGNSVYSLVIPARNWDEAQARVKRIGAFGRVIGSDVTTVPGSLGWLAKLTVWWRNLQQAGRK